MGMGKDLEDADLLNQRERAARQAPLPEENRGPGDDYRGSSSDTHPGCMLLVSGRVFSMLAPTWQMFTVDDVAHHLALTNRWACATRDPYSVAQHSMLVASMVPSGLQAAAMLHDVHEFVIGDRTRPFKQIMPPEIRSWWNGIANAIDRAACEAFGVDHALLSHHLIKIADMVALAAEGRDLVANFREHVEIPHTNSGDPLPDCSHVSEIHPWPWERARDEYRTHLTRLLRGWPTTFPQE